MTAKDGNLRNALVTVSILNPQTNTYTQMGRTYVAASRSKGNIVMCILGPGRKVIAAAPANAQIDWTIMKEVYCTFVDTRNTRYLLLFASAQEARIFTMIALAAKLNSQNDPICIVKRAGPAFPENDRFPVNYACYDTLKAKIDNPIMQEENFEIGPTDETPMKQIAKGGQMGSVFLVKCPHGVVAIVESIRKGQALPSLPGYEADDVEDAQPEEENEQPQEKPKKRKHRKSEKKDEPEPEVQQPAPAKRLLRPGEVRPQPMYDSQLESIRKEMQDKFSELMQHMASLRRTQAVQNNVALTSDVLVSSVQRLLKENQAKDQLIAEKQQLIDLLNERRADTRERDAMHIQLGELMSKLSAQRQLTTEKTDQQKELRAQIENLQAQVIKANVDAKARLTTLHQQLELEKQQQFEEVEQSRRQLVESVKFAEEEVAKVRALYQQALARNKILSSESKRDYTEQLELLKTKSPIVIQNAIKKMVSGVFEIFQEAFDDETEYDSTAIMNAVKSSLQQQANRMMEEIDPDDDEEEDEEETEPETQK